MAKQEDTVIFERMDRIKTLILHRHQEIYKRKKYITKRKSKIFDSVKQRDNLKKYLNLSKSLLRTSSQNGHYLEITTNLKDEIEEVQNAMVRVKQDIAVLESKRKLDTTPVKEEQILVKNMKKVLSELHDIKFNKRLEKEKQLGDLKNQNLDDISTMFKDKKEELEITIKEYETIKQKNIHLREMISINIL